jgi:hypothetical protein
LPTWLLVIIPIVAIFLAGFNIYRQGTADVRIVFIEEKNPQYDCSNSLGNREYNFTGAVCGHLFNFGPQSGVLEKISYKVGFNGIFDEYILSRMLLACQVSPLLVGKVDPSEKKYLDKKIALPLVLKPSDIQPFTLVLDLSISVSLNEESILEILQWLKFINLKVTYVARQSDGVVNKDIKIDISAEPMFEAVLDTEGGIQSFQIE